jgi:hypothetical protein
MEKRNIHTDTRAPINKHTNNLNNTYTNNCTVFWLKFMLFVLEHRLARLSVRAFLLLWVVAFSGASVLRPVRQCSVASVPWALPSQLSIFSVLFCLCFSFSAEFFCVLPFQRAHRSSPRFPGIPLAGGGTRDSAQLARLR